MTTPAAGPVHEAAGKVDEAARQLEAYFLRRVLAEVKIGQGGMLSGGYAGETFQQMFNDAIADAMAEAGGIGISDVIMRQIDGSAPMITGSIQSQAPLALSSAASPRIDLASPVAGTQTSSFGPRTHPISGKKSFHAGIDIGAASGTPVTSFGPGVVTRAGPAGGYGNLVVIEHDGGVETRYAHLSTIDVSVGDKIRNGQTLGTVGATGTATGPHLHFEVRQSGVASDPKGHLSASDHVSSDKIRQKNDHGLNSADDRPNRSRGGY